MTGNQLVKIQNAYKRRLFLKSILSNEFLPRRIRLCAQNYLSFLPKKTRIYNSCKESSRSHSVIRAFRLSRHMVRRNAEQGFLLGVRRSSW